MSKKVILVGVSGSEKDFDYTMLELRNLAEANHYQVVDEVRQNLDSAHKATYVGKGKLEELKQLGEMQEAKAFVLNDELTGSQIRNLEDATGFQIIDRTALILSIFAERAKTREAQLQVEIARLKYELPRMIGEGESLDQQGGGSGLRNRGSGEKKLEQDRRIIKDRISKLTKELDAIVAERETRRRKRKKNEIPVVSLVGYTNAGKSTTMNGLVADFSTSEHKQVFEKDMLFATLETSVREIVLPDHKRFLLTDTVGFVSKLPTHLVKAFRSTLEEARDADLLIHVVDYSDPNYQTMIETTECTLKEVGVEGIPVLFAYNKADKIAEENYPVLAGDTLVYSARDEASLFELAETVKKRIFTGYKKVTLLIPFEEGQVVAYLNDKANVLSEEYLNEGTKVEVELSPVDQERLKKFRWRVS
ncbi:GTPase HflX [Listeria aquatica]|uniref:GTPase HflX n=1 Tax=Listeria aquatica FSL S10-1188 TaxID=1265818 RepID=W7BAA9_9LIST|nr:GTPase HflX [Listeria aquatica]EUJ21610.1 putative ATP/GTP-binding protein [Listeria aquatica FSL S10-1188]